ncbi:MAG TPA: hypothetical protein VGI96_29815 [Streptosporangiaceae bacterium]|jgi:hypothetical protein
MSACWDFRKREYPGAVIAGDSLRKRNDGGWNSMRKNRLIITLAALGSAASMAGLAAPVMAAPDTAFSCPTNDQFSGPPTTFTVKTTGIHIRKTPAPNGTVLYSIAKGASFRSSWSADGMSFDCISKPVDGKQYILGWDVSNNNHVGWVGRSYLSS